MAVPGVQARLLVVTDRLVGLTPSPLRALLNRPVDGPQFAGDVMRARVLRFAVIASVVLAGVLGAGHVVNSLLLDGRSEVLNADNDESALGWAGVAAQATVAAVLGLLAAGAVRHVTLTFCAVTMTFLSFDDFIQIHEKVGGLASPFPHAGRVLWPVLYLPLLATLFVQLWRVAQNSDAAERALVRGGLLALVISVGLELGTVLLFAGGQGRGSAAYEIEVAIEESLELMGWMWVGGGLAAQLIRRWADGKPRAGGAPTRGG